jgi:hypothetical protein
MSFTLPSEVRKLLKTATAIILVDDNAKRPPISASEIANVHHYHRRVIAATTQPVKSKYPSAKTLRRAHFDTKWINKSKKLKNDQSRWESMPQTTVAPPCHKPVAPPRRVPPATTPVPSDDDKAVAVPLYRPLRKLSMEVHPKNAVAGAAQPDSLMTLRKPERQASHHAPRREHMQPKLLPNDHVQLSAHLILDAAAVTPPSWTLLSHHNTNSQHGPPSVNKTPAILAQALQELELFSLEDNNNYRYPQSMEHITYCQ